MTIELMQTVSLALYIAAGVFLLVSIALFFLLEVPKLIGDISGSTARKAIESIRQQNETTGDKAYKPSAVNASRGKVTDKITKSGKLVPKEGVNGVALPTERFDTAELNSTAGETAVLDFQSNETTILGETNNGEVLASADIVVNGETTVLSNEQYMSDETQASYGDNLNVDVEMGFTGSSELIE